MDAPHISSPPSLQDSRIDSFLAVNLAGTSALITWRIGEQGFDMQLSGQVPGELRNGLQAAGKQITQGANHPKSISGLCIPAAAPFSMPRSRASRFRLKHSADSRDILRQFGNMSSASVMFVLERLMHRAHPGQRGCAMSFGPGVTAETMLFHAV